jgi:ATP-dependent DNA helicase RecG
MLTEPVTQLKGVGPALAERLAKLGLSTVQDLVFHLPLRYEDRTRIVPLTELKTGNSALVEGSVTEVRVEAGRKRSLLVRLRDSSGEIGLRYYFFTAQQQSRFSPGRRFKVYGEPRPGRSGLEMYHPETELVDITQPGSTEQLFTPVYPVTEGIQQKRIRDLCCQALVRLAHCPVRDWLPRQMRARLAMPELNEALLYLHQPPLEANLRALAEGQDPCQQRLVLEELLAHHLSLLKLRQNQQAMNAPVITSQSALIASFLHALPFRLTAAQQRVVNEITNDLSASVPMLRLLQGDVGCGKTVVACCAALSVVSSGLQVAFMAPTEILAEQHFHNLVQWLEPFGVSIGWLTGKARSKERLQTLLTIESGTLQVITGTHALFQDEVKFHKLGLIIVDEQHRFGVHQRLALRAKGASRDLVPHQLIMTATPIPRTLAMSAYADLDTSVIDELPVGRMPVVTAVLADSRRQQVIDRVEKNCRQGRQAYWVCTLIEESEALQCQAAEATAEDLQSQLPDLSVGLVHGRMKATEKALVMEQFKAGQIDLLVATTVIEVGVDVPNASLMIIENPERLGLAQLHQLRGRVGRGGVKSFCLLLYRPPLSSAGKARLQVMRDSNDGFVIAEKDLEIRGPGEVLGTRQTGLMQFRIANLLRDQHWLPTVKKMADQLLNDPEATQGLIDRWIGQRENYGNV